MFWHDTAVLPVIWQLNGPPVCNQLSVFCGHFSGLHAKGKNCNPADRVQVIEKLLSDNANSLYPDRLVVNGYPSVPRRVHKPNGGWGDIRDHELCIAFTHPDTHS